MKQAWADLTLTGKVLLITLVILSCLLAVYATQPTTAQDTAPTWEYSMMFYSTDDLVAYTNDPAETNALNKLFVEDGESVGLLGGLNVMGDGGWELASVVPGSTSIYMFKRPG